MNEAVIVEAVRTPFGRRGGWWADKRPDDLLAEVIQGLLARAGLPGGGGRCDRRLRQPRASRAPTSAGCQPCWPACRRRCRAWP